MVLCVAFLFIWTRIAATIANWAQPKTLNRVTGVVLLALGVAVLGVHFL
ncbi:MAG: hypothetical protein HPZ79_09060 [Oscillospiraceae bacterium]|nr:hypothetical protein [Oscillospiraceae bacterium]